MAQVHSLPFRSPYRHGFVRLAACVPKVSIGRPQTNLAHTLDLVHSAAEQGVALMVFPELGLSGYSLDDLFQQQTLLDSVQQTLLDLAEGSRGLQPAFVVGAPLRFQGRLFNCAIVIQNGAVLGAIPKTYLPNYREFYERRWFASGQDICGEVINLGSLQIPFGQDLLFQAEGNAPFIFHAEICEDVWGPIPPSSYAAMGGAEILLNLSASNIVIGKADARRQLCGAQSARCLAAYAYSAAGAGESTTDLAWDGQASIFELGTLLAETPRFSLEPQMAICDIDVGRIRQERLRTGSFGDAAGFHSAAFRRISFEFEPPEDELDLIRDIERFPYVPSDPSRLQEQCHEAFSIQVQGLAQRLRSAGLKSLVIGISGGLDSTHALLVATKVMDQLGLPHANILAYTLPGFATSPKTHANAWALMKSLGVTAAEIDIRPAARQMLSDLGHPYSDGIDVYDVTFENVQAGLRTDYLFRLANQAGGLVVGTGDLSELALGWCTYGVGDHMSHYGVNASVSKTLIQHLIRYVAGAGEVSEETARVLESVLATEITPELIPATSEQPVQATEAKIGPYELQDFNLYYLSRFGFAPSKIAYLSWCAWHDQKLGSWPVGLDPADRHEYRLSQIKSWLKLFLERFFTNQFKRSCIPNGPKISSGGSLSPRGDWRAPSDMSPELWVAELVANVPDEV
jgi:NAD+ synthase (glutamine-hydrolysing)